MRSGPPVAGHWFFFANLPSLRKTSFTVSLGGQRGHHGLQEFVGGSKAPLELVGEVILIVSGVVELVFVFDVHGAAVAGFGQDGEKALPIDRALAGNAKAPPLGIIHRIDAGTAQDVPENFAVLEVHVVDFVGEIAGGLNRVHELPDQVRGVELQSYVGAVLKALEKRFPADRSGTDVGSAGVGFPEDADLVFLAKREILLGVDFDDFVNLFLKGPALDGAALAADVGDAEFAAEFQAGDGVLVLPFARGGVGIDVVAIHGQRGYIDSG